MHPWISTCTMRFDVSFIIFSGIFAQAITVRHIQSVTLPLQPSQQTGYEQILLPSRMLKC